ncbi:MAG: NAD(P)/FAD-dependent oxidoreductase [Chloroflexi bacterium]|nr:NAD(P)/FAD-dependent oxidoreductase [Chloroflexota bacterium]
MPQQTHVIVGASLAGASAAAALRKRGFDGRIVLIGDEPHLPYERPELSKKYLRGEVETPVIVHDEAFYADSAIELLRGRRVTGLDLDARRVIIDAETIRFDRLLVGTGASPRPLGVPGEDLPGVHRLRTLEDADAIREAAARASGAVVVGGGWIGSEVAASLRQLGLDVAVVSLTPTPLEHVLGAEIGAIYRETHEGHGVRFVTGSRVRRILGTDRATGVETDDGRRIEADLVIVGVGADPRTDLAVAAGLEVRNGIVVGANLETGAPGVFAAGDVANAWHPFYRRHLRVEHWDNAKRQGRAAAASMLGEPTSYDRIPYFYSDQYELGMEYTGHALHWDEVVIRGDREARELIAFWLSGGRVVAGMNMNVWDVAPAIERLVRSRSAIDRDRLADPDAPLEALAPAA